MNLKSNIITRLFSEDEIAHLGRAVEDGKELLKYIEKILESRWGNTLPKEADFDKNNYEFRRAFLDGRGFEIAWLVKLLQEGEDKDA